MLVGFQCECALVGRDFHVEQQIGRVDAILAGMYEREQTGGRSLVDLGPRTEFNGCPLGRGRYFEHGDLEPVQQTEGCGVVRTERTVLEGIRKLLRYKRY